MFRSHFLCDGEVREPTPNIASERAGFGSACVMGNLGGLGIDKPVINLYSFRWSILGQKLAGALPKKQRYLRELMVVFD